jgi:outer membrane PBP1 activator LpoA protein
MQITSRPLPLFLLLLSILLAQGCAPVIKPDQDKTGEPTQRTQIDALLETGEYAAAAEQLESLAVTSPPPEQEALRLEAGELWGRAGEWGRVEALLPLIPQQLPPDLADQYRMLKAEFALSQRNLDQALDLLHPPTGPEAPVHLRQRYHRNMAEVFRLTGNMLESARELVELDALLSSPHEKLNNQMVLIEALSTLTDTALGLLQPSPPGVLGGWMDLTRIIKRRDEDPTSFEPRIEAWREEFPEHPALPELLTSYFELQTLDHSSHIAIFLPRSGPYAKVAVAVRDGFMAAWYQRPLESRPVLRFYDSSNAQGIVTLYQKAVLQGAQMIVGPLDKEAVNLLLLEQDPIVPILALNQADHTGSVLPNLFQFGLAPEDEAEQVAERAWLEGYSRALVLTPGGEWGERLAQSFNARWRALGGAVLESQAYDAKGNDFSAPIRQLLNIDESDARKDSLQRVIGFPMESEPRRREDAHFIFLAARPQKGRQLKPQLKFHHAGDLPVFATSHIYSGVADADRDRDLGQIMFVDTPWLLEQESDSQLSRNRLQRLMPGVQSHYARLYAMGIDAFNLLPHLPRMRERAGYTVSGKTGNLYLDGYNRLHRQLAWAEMKQGVASITGYAPRLEQINHAIPSTFPDTPTIATPEPIEAADDLNSQHGPASDQR